MREKILKIIESTKKSGHKFEPIESFKKKQIENAMNRIVKSSHMSESMVVAIMDTTLFGSCKKGYLLTTAAFYADDFDEPIRLNNIVKVENSPKNSYDSIVTLKSGEKITLFTSAYREYLNEILNKIAKTNGVKEESTDEEKAEPKKTAKKSSTRTKKAESKPVSDTSGMTSDEIEDEKARLMEKIAFLDAEKKKLEEEARKEAAEKEAAEKAAAEKAAAEKAAAEKAAAEKAEQDRIQEERINAIVEELKEKIEKARNEAQPAQEEKPVAVQKPKSAMFAFDDEENDLYIEELEKVIAKYNKRIKAQAQRRAEEKKFAEQMSEEDREYKNALESLNAYHIKSEFPGPKDEQMNPLCTKDENEIKRLQEAEELFLSGELMRADTIFRDIAYPTSNPYAYFMLAKVLMKCEEEEHNEKKKKELVKEIEDCLGISANRGYYPAAEHAFEWYTERYDGMDLYEMPWISEEIRRMANSLIYAGNNEALRRYVEYLVEADYGQNSYTISRNRSIDEPLFIISRYRAKYQRDDDAARALVWCYRYGLGTEQDYDKADKAYFFEID
ncbi:MAG: hypothetical protein IJN37_10645 [Clostridia bacterium]|nr:hypothetical protein [Clostridia bacterium]